MFPRLFNAALVLLASRRAAASGICASEADYVPNNIVSQVCSSVSNTSCVGMNLEWKDDGKCEASYNIYAGNTLADGSDAKAACEAKGGTVSNPTTCQTYVNQAMPNGFEASVSTCAATNTVFQRQTSVITRFLWKGGCCGSTGQDSCLAIHVPTFRLCGTESDYSPSVVMQVECSNVAESSCTGKTSNQKEEFQFDQGKCRSKAVAPGANVFAACTAKGGVPRGRADTCHSWLEALFPGAMTVSAATCAATSAMGGKNQMYADMLARNGCCKNANPSCCSDVSACLATSAPTPAPTAANKVDSSASSADSSALCASFVMVIAGSISLII